jgi:hypothetical protein
MTVLRTQEDFFYQRAALLDCDLTDFFVPTVPANIAKLGWVAVPDSEYCGVTFTKELPEDFDTINPIHVAGDTLYVYGSDGRVAHYFKYKRAA